MSQCDPSSFLGSFPGQTTINGACMGSSSIKEWQNNSNLLASHQVGAEGSSQQRLPLLSMLYQESDYWQSVHENSTKLQKMMTSCSESYFSMSASIRRINKYDLGLRAPPHYGRF